MPGRSRQRPAHIPMLDWLAMHSRYQPGTLLTECRVWRGRANRRGYGLIGWRDAKWLVHRVAWIERNGPIPPETPCVLHRCDNPPCWREGHLWLGTVADNNADMWAKGRGVVPSSQLGINL